MRGAPGCKPRPAASRAPTLAIVVLLAALVALPMEGQSQGVPVDGLVNQHRVVVEATELAVFEDGNTTRMTEVRGCQGAPLITFAPDGNSFTFEEQGGGLTGTQRPTTGCAAALYNVVLPGAASVLSVDFTADRVITNETPPPCIPVLGGCVLESLRMVQEFQIDFPDGSSGIHPYFSVSEGSKPPTTFHREFLLPAGVSNLTLQWFFQDEGYFGDAAGDPGRAQLTSTVSNITLRFDGIRLPNPAGASGPEQPNGERTFSQVVHWVNVTVPPDAIGDRRSSAVTLEVRRGPALVEMSGPAGTVAEDRFQATRVGERIRYTVDPETVAEQGPGTYSYHFATTVALPPQPPVTPPTFVYAFYYVIALLPLVAAILALHQATLYVRQAEGTYKRTAWPVLVAIALVVVYYLILLGYSYFGITPERMSRLPLAREPLLVYVQFVLLLLMLAGSALAVSRTLIGTMRRDIEERRRKEDQLRRSNEELERFAYVASHDLQEPLRKVAGFTALLQKRYEGRLDRDADEIIQYAVDGATRMQHLIKDILAYSRVGSKELQPMPIDANATMQLVASDLSEQIKDHRAEVKWDALPTVRADASQLRQVLQNLVENAIKYRHAKRRPKVRVSAREDGRDWHFTVADNGEGIPADKHGEIFGIFRRLHGQEHPGTGIGLAVAKKAVERHGGKIWVESTPGKGATFHFTLPREAPGPPARWTPRAQGSRGAPGL